jgi:hypothetical protein
MNHQLRQNVNLNLTTQLTNIGKGLEIFNKQNEDKKKQLMTMKSIVRCLKEKHLLLEENINILNNLSGPS